MREKVYLIPRGDEEVIAVVGEAKVGYAVRRRAGQLPSGGELRRGGHCRLVKWTKFSFNFQGVRVLEGECVSV